MISDQKKSVLPLSPVMRESLIIAAAKSSAPIAIRYRASNLLVSRPTIAIDTAVASAPGSRTMPVCCAVMRRLLCRNTGSVKTEA